MNSNPDGPDSDDSISSGDEEVEISSQSEPESPNAVCDTYLSKACVCHLQKLMVQTHCTGLGEGTRWA